MNRNQLPTNTTTGTDLKDILLNERRVTPKPAVVSFCPYHSLEKATLEGWKRAAAIRVLQYKELGLFGGVVGGFPPTGAENTQMTLGHLGEPENKMCSRQEASQRDTGVTLKGSATATEQCEQQGKINVELYYNPKHSIPRSPC